MMKQALMGLSALSLLACTDVAQDAARTTTSALADFTPESVVVQPQSANYLQDGLQRSAKSSPTQPGNQGADPAGVYLAYRYGYGLVMASAAVKPTSDKHMQICRDAGPSKCQITGSNTNNYSDENIQANLSLRAEPDWLQTFITGMKADIADIDGRIQSENTSVEDLTRSILDTDSRLKAQKTLRSRLENLLETRNAKLPDLLTLERELARVQTDIESATANLKALRARVSMSVVNLTYTSERVAVSRSSVSPIGVALKDFVGIVSRGIAGVIRLVAILLPWMIFVIIPGLFLFLWFWRRRKTVKTSQ